MEMPKSTLAPFGLLFAVQVLDVAIHVTLQQVEPIRIAASLIVLAGAIIAAWRLGAQPRRLVLLAGAAYLLLNLVFVTQNGLTNPATGALRLPLVGFVLLSLGLLAWLHQRLRSG